MEYLDFEAGSATARGAWSSRSSLTSRRIPGFTGGEGAVFRIDFFMEDLRDTIVRALLIQEKSERPDADFSYHANIHG